MEDYYFYMAASLLLLSNTKVGKLVCIVLLVAAFFVQNAYG